MKIYNSETGDRTFRAADNLYYLRMFAPITCRNSRNCYKTLQFLGKGGNGSVYLTLCVSSDSEHRGEYFALKFFQRNRNLERLRRFQEEIEFLKEINHPNIIKYYDDGTYEIRHPNYQSLPFFISSYMPNTLDIVMKNCSRGQSLMYATQLLSALKKLEQEQIVHRDIKPQNIFANGLSLVLGDFGLMKRLSTGNLSNDSFNEDIDALNHSLCPGQPFYYRSPDIIGYARGEKQLTTKSDIFQMGLVFAEIFGGRNPLKPAQSILDPIEFEEQKLGFIKGNSSRKLLPLLSGMLEIIPDFRPSIDELLNGFIGILEDYARTKFDLDGQLL